jgi:hypothetical protein
LKVIDEQTGCFPESFKHFILLKAKGHPAGTANKRCSWSLFILKILL